MYGRGTIFWNTGNYWVTDYVYQFSSATHQDISYKVCQWAECNLSCDFDGGDDVDPVICALSKRLGLYLWECSFTFSDRNIGRTLLEISINIFLSADNRF